MENVTVKPGWTTSQGQLSALVIAASMILAFFGIHQAPEQINSYLDLLNTWAETLMPLLVILGTVINYTNSRGKTYSNAIKADASVQVASLVSSDPTGVSNIVASTNWKDPATYEKLLNVAGQLGVPGASEADKINQQIHPVELIKGILGMFKK